MCSSEMVQLRCSAEPGRAFETCLRLTKSKDARVSEIEASHISHILSCSQLYSNLAHLVLVR